ncbi:MAG: folylpolyglutamate synthase/dihydrofolate synthase family protein [Moraxella sp.]|nr:folylpolyglutamate synthase/dihydrofolate synthase family protein [Moraxella sp.]
MTTPQTVSDWLIYMQNIHVSAIDMGLERVLPVASELGILTDDLPQKPYVFTVAGTNGKGSTTSAIASICTQAGYKTALYQSPHLVSFNERISIDGVLASDNELIDAFEQVERARLNCGLSLSFFEMTTLAAFWIFKHANCDVWVLEVGLGGRLDVVNIIDPDMCVITNIGIDHTDWLGDTREQIGFEKAGILRQNSTLIFGESDMPHSVKAVIDDKQASCYQYGKDYLSDIIDDGWIYSGASVTLKLPLPSISPINASTAISGVLASPLAVSTDDICQGLSNVHLSGRFDKRAVAGKRWVFDVGHNEHGIRFLMASFVPYWQALTQTNPHAKLHFLFSMLADKDTDKVLSLIGSYGLPIHAWHIGKIDNVRATSVAQLHNKIITNLPNSTVLMYDTVALATDGVLKATDDGDVVLCFGSFYTISESMIALGLAKNPKTG